MKKIIYILFILAFVSLANAQITQEWAVLNSGTSNNGAGAFSMVIDGSGNVYVAGVNIVSGSNYDFLTIKYNTSGVQQWVATYNGPGNGQDIARSIAIDGSGNVYVAGESMGSGTSYDYCTIKYNASGVQQWLVRYNGTGNNWDKANSLAVDGLDNVYVTGASVGTAAGCDYCTIKYNTSGIQQWVQRYHGNGNPGHDTNWAKSIAVDGSGNVYVTGRSDTWTVADNYATVKYNTSGVQQWVATYDGPGHSYDGADAITVDGLGNVYITGRSLGSGTGADFCTIKYNSSGAPQWVARYDWSNYQEDAGNDIAVDAAGNVYVTGRQGNLQSMGRDYCTIKYNSSGTQQWVARHNGPGDDDDEAYSLTVDGFGNVYVTGASEGIGTKEDYCTIKYNDSGVQQWFIRHNGPYGDNDEANSLAIDGSGNVYVSGVSFGTIINSVTIKYSQPFGIKTISTEIPSTFSLSQNYPNPFNPTTNIKFALPKSNYVTLKIYDALGREVATLVNEQLKAGTYQVDWDGSSYASGVYYYRLVTDNFSETKKMLMIK